MMFESIQMLAFPDLFHHLIKFHKMCEAPKYIFFVVTFGFGPAICDLFPDAEIKNAP